MAVSAKKQQPKCPDCGNEMKLVRSWSRKTRPLFGNTVEMAAFVCQECETEHDFENGGREKGWIPVGDA
ncbi:MAG: hypothetical protein ABEJ58_10805 [Halodesulfurarchaeum sp.]